MTPAGRVEDFLISPDGAMVVFRGGSVPVDLFSVPVAGGTQVQLNNRNNPWTGLDVDDDYQICPDSSRVVYRGDDLTEPVFEVYSVPISGGTRIRLNGPLATNGSVRDFAVSPDAAWVVYRGEQLLEGWTSGQRAPAAGPSGSDEVIWSGPYAETFRDYRIHDSSSTVVVRGNLALVDGVERLWEVPLTGTPEPAGDELVPVADFHANGDVTSFVVGAAGTVVYVADQIVDERFELFAYHPPLFVDGFESGDLSAWSSSVP